MEADSTVSTAQSQDYGRAISTECELDSASSQLPNLENKETSSESSTNEVHHGDAQNNIHSLERKHRGIICERISSRWRIWSQQMKDSLTRSGKRGSAQDPALPPTRNTRGQFTGYRGGLLAATITCGTI